ncbi:hypothetical protein ACT1U9_31575 [Streptomyces sp. BR1]|uniref:hypothetical protein n=1 Tax=Streptomyces sp. BR1 TaxID=1592323 RepID=UPI00402BBA01
MPTMARQLTFPGLLVALPPLLFPLAVTLPSGLPADQVVLASTIGLFPAVLSTWLASQVLSRHSRLRHAALTGCVSTSLFGCLIVGSVYYGFVFAPLLVLLFGLLGLLSLRGTWTLAQGWKRGAVSASLPLCLIAAFGLHVSTSGAAGRLVHLVGWTCLALAVLICSLTLVAPRKGS